MSGEEDPYAYEYQPEKEGKKKGNEIDKEYNQFYDAEEKVVSEDLKKDEPVREEFYNDGVVFEDEPEDKIEDETILKSGIGFVKISMRDIPLPCFDPYYFQNVRDSEHPWMILITYLDVFMDTLMWIGIFVSVVICCCICPIQFFGKYLTIYKGLTSKGFGKSMLIVYFIVSIISTCFYVYFMVGVVGTTGIIQYFLIMAHGSDISVVVFYGMNSFLLVGWGICILGNLTIFGYYLLQAVKKCKKSGGSAKGGNKIDPIGDDMV